MEVKADTLPHLVTAKVEMDNSYKAANESGYSSQPNSSGKWECHENEITDTRSFDPMPVCSSNIKNEMPDTELSSIVGDHVQDINTGKL